MNKGMTSGMTAPAKTPELDRVQEESDIAFKALSEVAGQLISRLSKVMCPPNPETENGKAEPKYYSKLAQDIDSHNNDIWSVTHSIESVLERLEI